MCQQGGLIYQNLRDHRFDLARAARQASNRRNGKHFAGKLPALRAKVARDTAALNTHKASCPTCAEGQR